MPPNGRTLTVYLTADTKKAQKQLSGFQKTMKTLGKVGAVAAAAGVAVLGKKLIDLGGEAVALASDLDEVNSKINVLFGEAQARKIDDWASNSAEAMGLTSLAAKDAAAQYAVFGKSAGLTGAELTTFSTDLVALASDLASFNNTSLEQALGAIQSGLAGSSEPLLAFGKNLKESQKQAYAVANGITEAGAKMTEQEKILATYGALLEQSADEMGDFARTSEGLANKSKILEAKLGDLKAEIGQSLLPVVLEFKDILLNVLLPAFQEVWQKIEGPLMEALQKFSEWMRTDGRGALNTFVDLMRYQFIPLMAVAYDYVARIIEPFQRMASSLNDIAVAFGAGNPNGVNPELSKFTRYMVINEPVLEAFIFLLNKIADALAFIAAQADTAAKNLQKVLEIARNVGNLNPLSGMNFGPTGGLPRSPSPVNITVQAGVGDPVEIARVIKRTLGDANQRLGVSW